MREQWKAERDVEWSEGLFNALERFVDSKPSENRSAFAETGDLEELFDGAQIPSPPPSSIHQQYMLEYAQQNGY
jgi:hypothetical protein